MMARFGDAENGVRRPSPLLPVNEMAEMFPKVKPEKRDDESVLAERGEQGPEEGGEEGPKTVRRWRRECFG